MIIIYWGDAATLHPVQKKSRGLKIPVYRYSLWIIHYYRQSKEQGNPLWASTATVAAENG